jgi:hypothetical protein
MFQVLLGGLMNMLLFALVIAGVAKLYQLHSELGEIKELLKDIKRNSEIENLPVFGRPGSQQQLHHLQQAMQSYAPQAAPSMSVLPPAPESERA